MSEQPPERLPAFTDRDWGILKRLFAGVVIIGVAWAILAGMAGYTLGNPPTGLDATASCYQITRVLWVVPMWKSADAATCANSSIAPQ